MASKKQEVTKHCGHTISSFTQLSLIIFFKCEDANSHVFFSFTINNDVIILSHAQ